MALRLPPLPEPHIDAIARSGEDGACLHIVFSDFDYGEPVPMDMRMSTSSIAVTSRGRCERRSRHSLWNPADRVPEPFSRALAREICRYLGGRARFVLAREHTAQEIALEALWQEDCRDRHAAALQLLMNEFVQPLLDTCADQPMVQIAATSKDPLRLYNLLGAFPDLLPHATSRKDVANLVLSFQHPPLPGGNETTADYVRRLRSLRRVTAL